MREVDQLKYRLVIALAVAATAAALWVGSAFAADGPHGPFTSTPLTDKCAGCHRAHTGLTDTFLVELDVKSLCLSCHDGSGALTNVVDGQYGAGATAPSLNGGGFVNFKGKPTTSSHSIDETTNQSWGYQDALRGNLGALHRGTDFAYEVTCTTCHSAHGSADNYRNLRTRVDVKPSTLPAPAPTLPTGPLKPGSTKLTASLIASGTGNPSNDYITEAWGTGTSYFCRNCHNNYYVNPADTAFGVANPDANGTYGHHVDMTTNAARETTGLGGYTVPLATFPGATAPADNVVVCETCHLAHGSSAAMSGYANGGPVGGGTLPGNTTATDSALLRLDNRGVCEVCHQR